MRHRWVMKWTSRLALVVLSTAMTAVLIQEFAMTPAHGDQAVSTHRGWVAHSAYGLQLSVPKSWDVAYFRNCPEGGPGTLLIGTPVISSSCAAFPLHPNIVTMQQEKSEAIVRSTKDKSLKIRGIRVVTFPSSGQVTWVIPSRDVGITAYGTGARAVLRTLAPATTRAQAALGMLMGTEKVEAVMQVPVTGPISVVRLDAHGPELPKAQAFDGQFTDLLPPGHYALTGHDGNAPCPTIMVTVQSGRTIDAPAIDCQGM
jgi:hypothetical protein